MTRRAFHRACSSGRHTAHGRYPAATAVCSSAKNTRFVTYPPRATARSAAGQSSVQAARPIAAERAGGCALVGLPVRTQQRVRPGGHAAPSSVSRARLASTPPTYCPIVPSLRTTRWQGTTTGRGLLAHALPAARTAFGWPAAFATAA